MTSDIFRNLIVRAMASMPWPIEKERIEIHLCTQDFYSLLRSCDRGELLNTFLVFLCFSNQNLSMVQGFL